MMYKILLLEDDLSLIDGLSYSLKKQGYDTDVARTIGAAYDLWTKGSYDLLILDLSLPDGSGFEICETVRQTSHVPIVFLTASDEEVSIVKGLDIGGDDYITKPFKLGVLLSRINALLRRVENFKADQTELLSNGIKVRLLQGQAYLGGQPLELTNAEYRLLCLMMQNPNLVLAKDQILNQLWDGVGSYVDDNTLAVYVRRLRMKIEENPAHPQKILTVRGVGYKWNVAP